MRIGPSSDPEPSARVRLRENASAVKRFPEVPIQPCSLKLPPTSQRRAGPSALATASRLRSGEKAIARIPPVWPFKLIIGLAVVVGQMCCTTIRSDLVRERIFKFLHEQMGDVGDD